MEKRFLSILFHIYEPVICERFTNHRLFVVIFRFLTAWELFLNIESPAERPGLPICY